MEILKALQLLKASNEMGSNAECLVVPALSVESQSQ